jgi:hypothetical protein
MEGNMKGHDYLQDNPPNKPGEEPTEPIIPEPSIPQPEPDPYPVTDPVPEPNPHPEPNPEPPPFPVPPEPIPQYPPDIVY